MVFHLLKSKARIVPDATNGLISEAAERASSEAADQANKAAIRNTVDLFEQDVARNVRALAAHIGEASEKSAAVQVCLSDIESAVSTLVVASGRVDSEVSGIAGSADELSVAANEILETVAVVSNRSAAAVTSAEQSTRDVESLGAAINEIGGMLNAISEIASRTNLLALNATIEAARAGEAGRGFAVVAQEVKALSVAAGNAVTSIRERMEALESASARAIDGMKRICLEIGEMAPVAATISQAADEQRSTIVDLAGRMGDARIAVASVSESIRTIDRMSKVAHERCGEAADFSHRAEADASTLERRMTMLLRGTGVADRRQHERLPVDLAVRLRLRGEMLACRTFDVSEGGVLLRADARLTPAIGATLEAEISRIGAVSLKVAGLSPMGVHCAFGPLSEDARRNLLDVIAAFETEHRPLIERSQAFAREIEQAMKHDLDTGQLTIDALFDTDYQVIAETDPPQFLTKATVPLEKSLPSILERFLRMDDKMAFCLPVDRNGYGPVHNLKVSKPQKKGDRVWNTANCRNRRIFDDRAGLLAGRNTRPYLIQTYNRDMGNGLSIQMKEIDAPIMIAGRHWGGARMGYALT